MRDALEGQLLVEFRFAVLIIAAVLFLWAVGTFAMLALSWGTFGVVLLVIGLAILAALIVWELVLFWRRYSPRAR